MYAGEVVETGPAETGVRATRRIPTRAGSIETSQELDRPTERLQRDPRRAADRGASARRAACSRRAARISTSAACRRLRQHRTQRARDASCVACCYG